MDVAILLTLLGSFALSAALTPLCRALARRVGVVANPHSDRWHREPVPLLGGCAIVGAFALATVVSTPLGPLVPLFLATGLMFTLGTLDDILGFRPATKLVVQTIVAGVVVYLMPSATLTGIAPVDALLALVWVVGITNAFNLLDNIDGLSAGIAVIAGVFFLATLATLAAAAASPLSPAVAAFVGSALGFLIYNVRPASIFMGDGGSLFLGSFLGSIALLAAPELKAGIVPVAAIPLFILLIPIFDTAFVSVTRRLAGRSPMHGGRDHLSHRLVALGIDEKRAVKGLYLLAALGGLIALALQHVDPGYAAILIALYIILLAGIGVVLGHVEAHIGDPADMPSQPLISQVGYQNRVYEVLLDLALIALAYYTAFRVRFHGAEFTHFLTYFAASFPLVLACQLAGLAMAGKYRQIWRSFGAPELVGIIKGVAFGFCLSAVLILYLYSFQGFSRAVFAIDAVVLVFLLVGSRVAISSADEYLRRQRGSGQVVLIYGAGVRGALLVRMLLEDRTHAAVPVGFIDDDAGKRRLRLEGIPVVCAFADLDAVLSKGRIAEVIVSTTLDRTRLGELASTCRARGTAVRVMRFALEEIGPVPAIRHAQGR